MSLPNSDGRPPQQVSRFNAKFAGKSVYDIDAGGVDAALERTDIGPVDVGAMRQLFLREAFVSPVSSQVECQHLSDAILFTTSPLVMAGGDRACFTRVEEQVRLSRYGGDCYAYCMLAAGHVDLVIETELNAFDIAALIPIIEGAGGLVTTWEGAGAENGGRVVAAGDARIHAEALEILGG